MFRNTINKILFMNCPHYSFVLFSFLCKMRNFSYSHYSIFVNYLQILFKHFHHYFIIFRSVWKCTVTAYFYSFPVFFKILWITRAFFDAIHWTVTKHAVHLLNAFMTWIIFAFLICKKTIWIFHWDTSYLTQSLPKKPESTDITSILSTSQNNSTFISKVVLILGCELLKCSHFL